MKYIKLLQTVALATLSFSAFAQPVGHCGTDEHRAQLIQQYPQLKQAEEAANELILNQSAAPYAKKANGIIYIPVVFHVIHNYGLENITQAQIMDQIRILNEDFRKKAGTPSGVSTDPLASDIQIEFRLAQYDPSGKKSDGINRVQSTLTDNAGDAAKALSYWDSNRYLNIWVVKTINSSGVSQGGTILGYAQFPSDQSSRPTTDGVMIRSDQVGTIGTGDVSQAGRTLTHEVGHWLGLYHTFQNGCVGGTSSNCAAQGDRVCDTPPVSEASFGCQEGKNSCNNDVPDLADMIHNYMDYSNGNCLNLFTIGQKNRMYAQMALYRNTIYGGGANNVTYAGINPQTGDYNQLANASLKAPYAISFEGISFTKDSWKLNNFNNPDNGWKVNANEGYDGLASMQMQNFNNPTALINGRDGFQSPEMDLTGVPSPFVEFYYAYAQRSTASNDSLILIVSGDFGMHEDRIFAKRGADLATSGATTTEFIPTIASQWKKVSINISQYKYSNTRFRFEFVNRRGNNVYIDKFTITDGATGFGELAKQNLKFGTYPNPMHQQTTISYVLNETSNVEIILHNSVGKQIKTLAHESQTTGLHELILDGNGLAPGLYFIDFKSNQGSFTHKLLVN
jgi:hypothetical protein